MLGKIDCIFRSSEDSIPRECKERGTKVASLRRTLRISCFALSLLVPHAASAAEDSASGATLRVLQQSDSFLDIELRLEPSALELESLWKEGVEYTKVRLAESSESGAIGAPNLPVLSRLVEIPQGVGVELELLAVQSQRRAVSPVYPRQNPPPRCGGGEERFEIHRAHYEAAAADAIAAAALGEVAIHRGVAMARLELRPLRYDPVAGELEIAHSMRVRLHFSHEGSSRGGTVLRRRALSSAFSDRLLGDRASPAMRNDAQQASALPAMLVVLGKEEYREPMQKLAEWKERRGLKTIIKTAKELGGNSVDAIHAGIKGFYEDKSIDLAFVLLVGDKDLKAPTVKISKTAQMDSDGVGEADYRYTLLEGDDLIGDVSIGRFSVTNAAQVEAQVKKVLYYEREMGQASDSENLDWLESAIGVASSEKASGPSDRERMSKIIDAFKDAGYAQTDEFYQGAGADPDKLLSVINEGRAFISYMGHGDGHAWRFKDGFAFRDSHVKKVQVEKRWPIVMDCACTNGDFWNREPSFSEAWQRGGSSKEALGALAIVSSTIIAAWDPPAVMAEAMFKAVLSDKTLTLGGMLTAGLMKMAERYPNSSTMELTRDTFVMFGDPSLMVRAFRPQKLVLRTTIQDREGSKAQVQVMRKDPKKGEVPADLAVVALSHEGKLVASAATDKSGDAILVIPEQYDPEDLDLVVSGRRLVSYEGRLNRASKDESSKSKGSDKSGSKGSTSETSDSPEKSDQEKSESNSSSSDKESKGSKKKDKKDGGCDLQGSSGRPWIMLLGFVAVLGRARRPRQ